MVKKGRAGKEAESASSGSVQAPVENAKPSGGSSALASLGAMALRCVLFVVFCYKAVDVRLHAVRQYGRIIHEFDPWFNYRATEYLVAHGYKAFVDWFDYESWYPLGRPVGTTIYPGMMITSSWIYHTLHALGFTDVTVNDVCVFVPAGFAVITVTFTYLLALEVTGSPNMSIAATGIMAIIPAHLMRSVAGGYDNESIAVAAIVATFYFWIRSLRNDSSWWIGVLTGLAYTYMVAAWGAYTYVLNMVALHALALIIIGRFSTKLHLAYSLFFIVGTTGALQFPIVGWQPFDSMEQISALAVFILMQVVAGCFYLKNTLFANNEKRYESFIRTLIGGMFVVGSLVILFCLERGVLLPVTARIRGLFVEHTKTGNPLVDSVAEHQSTRPEVYVQYFNFIVYCVPFGFLFCLFNRTDAKYFFLLYIATSVYFSQKMIRLVLLLAPSASICGGIVVGGVLEWSLHVILFGSDEPVVEETTATAGRKQKQRSKYVGKSKTVRELAADKYQEISDAFNANKILRAVVAIVLLAVFVNLLYGFYGHSSFMSVRLSEPQIILKGRGQGGTEILVDDFREAYFWLRDNTPENSRVLSWWDYGYQINGVANRTTLADGNTWNHEHIALIGRTLISPEKQAHRIARHLADYVLVWTTRWAGMYGDDLAKCPHMARIASSVFPDINFKDYYMMNAQEPSPTLKKSLLYLLHGAGLDPRVPEPKYFEEAYTTSNKMVRIFKVKNVSEESRQYADEHHTYPPDLQPILEKASAFDRSKEKHYVGL